MILDRFAERVKTASLKEQRLIVLVFCLFSFDFCLLFAQSNLTYTLRVGTTGEVAVVDTFPEVYQAEKINIKVERSRLVDSLQLIDFLFTDRTVEGIEAWGEEVIRYTDTQDRGWIVWRKRQLPKNRQKKVLIQNAYQGFEQYVNNAVTVRRSTGWVWFVFAGLLLAGGIVLLCMQIIQRRREQHMTAVEQETLRRKRMGMRRHYGSQLYLWLLLLVLYAPIALIAVFSFTNSKILGNWTGFSMDLYRNLFTGQADAGLNSAIWYTIVIALIAAVCSTILGTLAAIGIYNMRARQRKVVSLMNSVPMINPDIITGISLFLLFVALGLSQGLATVCIAHVVFCTPYVVLSVLPRLSRMNPNTYEAALDLGATPAQALRMVMLPELWPGMLSGFILALTLSVDDFGVTFFTKGSGGLETLSTFIYSDARKGGLTPELRPLFTIILLVMLTALIIINLRNKKQEN